MDWLPGGSSLERCFVDMVHAHDICHLFSIEMEVKQRSRLDFQLLQFEKFMVRV